MSRLTTYHSKETVKARKVTDKDGESVVTSRGTVQAAKGDYVVHHDDGVTVQEAESFEARYKTQTTKRANRRPAAKRAEPPVAPVAQTGDESAADRVKAAKKAASASGKGK
jgi:hypothetical protein